MSSTHVSRIGASAITVLVLATGCSSSNDGDGLPATAVGGAGTFGGGFGTGTWPSATSGASGGGSIGGSPFSGGATSLLAGTAGAIGSGGVTGTAALSAAGGAINLGGTSALGGTTAGGAKAGGATGKGGSSTGGKSAGGASSGGTASGGTVSSSTKATGGSGTGGKSTGGASTGTTAAGGSVGGAATGGTSATTGSDGCSDTLALGVTLNEVAIFQSGKISVMKGGAEVAATTTYGADVVEGKSTLFRVYVKTDSGFQSRQLAARLTLNDGGATYYAKQTISGSSAELSTTNTFQIAVPASEIKAGLNYSVQIVECGTGSGTAHSPRFPESGTASVMTRATGTLKVTLIPVTANGITPSLNNLATALKPHLEAVYPTNLVEVTVASTPITGCNITPSTAADSDTWSNCLTLVRNRRTADRPANDQYYVGVVTPASTYRNYCGTACVGGVGYVATTASSATARALIAIGFTPEGLMTIAHELGHNHGLNHSPGCGAGTPDTAFPYQTNGTSYIGWVGWDSRTPGTFMDPAKYTDLLAYCNPVWVSDYVYSKLADRVAALNGAAMLLGSNAVSTWRVLDVIGNEAKWGPAITEPSPAFGEATSGTVLDPSGNALLEIPVYLTKLSHDHGSMYLVPEPQANWAYLRIGSIQVAF